MTTSKWRKFSNGAGTSMGTTGWVSRGTAASAGVYLYDEKTARDRGYAWKDWNNISASTRAENPSEGHTRADLSAYCEREGITLPPLPEEWCPEPVKEPAKPYSLADDPRLREVVRTKWGEARWEHLLGWSRLMLDGRSIAALYAGGEWFAYPGEFGDVCGARHGTATNPASAYDEVMTALRDLGSLVDEEPDADTGAVQMQTTRDRLLNLADRMFYSDRSATFYAGELRDLARELGGGDQ